MIWFKIGAASMFVTVAFGAFGAHALKQRLSPAVLEIYKTGVLYQAIHALAILIVGILAERHGKSLDAAGWCFTAGTVLFSGSLYILSLTGQKAWGAVTPLGGLCFLVGWAVLFLKVR